MAPANFLTPGILYINSGVAEEFRFLKPALVAAREAVKFARFKDVRNAGMVVALITEEMLHRLSQAEEAENETEESGDPE